MEIFGWLRHRPLLPQETNWPPSPAISDQRSLLKAIIHQIYLRFTHHRKFIRNHMIEIFTQVGLMGVQEIEKLRRDVENGLLEGKKQMMLSRKKEAALASQQGDPSGGGGGGGGVFAKPRAPSSKRVKVSGKELIESSYPLGDSPGRPPKEGKEEAKGNEKNSSKAPHQMVSLAGLNDLLEVMGSIIQGFRLPLRQEHRSNLLPALLSLHGLTGMLDEMTPVLTIYHKALSFCISKFIEKDPTLSTHIILMMVNRLWPKWNSKHEVLLWNELEEMLEFCVPPSIEVRSLLLFMCFD